MTYGSCRRDRCWRRAISRFPSLNCRRTWGRTWRTWGPSSTGEFERIIVPEGNLLDVNWRELQHAFPGAPHVRECQGDHLTHPDGLARATRNRYESETP